MIQGRIGFWSCIVCSAHNVLSLPTCAVCGVNYAASLRLQRLIRTMVREVNEALTLPDDRVMRR